MLPEAREWITLEAGESPPRLGTQQTQRLVGEKCFGTSRGGKRAGWEGERPVMRDEAGVLCAWVGGLDFISSTMRGH